MRRPSTSTRASWTRPPTFGLEARPYCSEPGRQPDEEVCRDARARLRRRPRARGAGRGPAHRPVRARAERRSWVPARPRWRLPSRPRTASRWCRWTASTGPTPSWGHGPARAKGAPDTFDAEGYAALLRRLHRPAADVLAPPAFDHRQPDPVPDAIEIPAEAGLVVTEGNYLLLDEPRWRAVRGSATRSGTWSPTRRRGWSGWSGATSRSVATTGARPGVGGPGRPGERRPRRRRRAPRRRRPRPRRLVGRAPGVHSSVVSKRIADPDASDLGARRQVLGP